MEILTVKNSIENLMLDRFYDSNLGILLRFGENDISAEEAIEELLKKDNRVTQFSVNSDTAFDSCGYTCGYISVAWVEDTGYLGHNTYIWEIV